jgi:hypothetical protein
MKHDRTASKGRTSAADHRAEQRNQKQNRAAQLSAANVEESPHMDKRDSAGGAGQSLGDAPDSKRGAEPPRRGALDTQYGTDSAGKTGGTGRASSGGSGASSGKGAAPAAPNPGSSEESAGSDRDTMSGPQPGSGD